MNSNIFIPLSILATIAIRKALTIELWKIISIAYIVIVLLWTSVSVVSYAKQQWDSVSNESLTTRFYPPKEYFGLVDWVKTNVRYEQVILASDEIGTLLVSQWPVFAYIGDQTHGSNWDLNPWSLQRFYSDQMSPSEALEWLKAHNVSYVVEDPKYIWPLNDLTYPFLIKRWHNDQLGIYQVNYHNIP